MRGLVEGWAQCSSTVYVKNRSRADRPPALLLGLAAGMVGAFRPANPRGDSMRRFATVLLSTALVPGSLFAQDYSPPKSIKPDEATRKAIAGKIDKLAKELTELRRLGVRDPVLAEVEVFHKAALWNVRHDEFYHKDSATGPKRSSTAACSAQPGRPGRKSLVSPGRDRGGPPPIARKSMAPCSPSP